MLALAEVPSPCLLYLFQFWHLCSGQLIFFSLSLPEDMLIDFGEGRGRRRGREREKKHINSREKHWLVASRGHLD